MLDWAARIDDLAFQLAAHYRVPARPSPMRSARRGYGEIVPTLTSRSSFGQCGGHTLAA